MLVYVLDINGNPLMPCKPAIARLLLKEKKAKVKRKDPFTIQLLYDSTKYTQEVVAGMDTGSKKIGTAAVANNTVLYQSETELRTDVSKKMQQRAMYRRNRRSRKTRYRKPRFLNRRNSIKEGRIPPTIKSKVNSHLREKRFVESILPVSKWIVETAQFDIHKISNPHVQDYQNGSQKNYYNVKAYVLDRDNYKCQSKRKCKCSEKLHVHHIVFRSDGGSNSPDNLITLCETCHDDLHNGNFEIKGSPSKTRHATHSNIIQSQLKKVWNFKETFGYETKYTREKVLGLSKTHYNDAVAICCKNSEVELSDVAYFKKHVCKGDYQQTKGKRSEKRIPTGKLFGFRKFDYLRTPKGDGFVKGKRSTGFFALADIFGNIISPSVNVKKNTIRLKSRKTTLIERSFASPLRV
jgi:hypothetical protein